MGEFTCTPVEGKFSVRYVFSCSETYQAFPFPVWVGGGAGSEVGSEANTSKVSCHISVVTTVTVISMESHNSCWTLTSPKFSNHDAQPFTTWSSPDVRILSKCLNYTCTTEFTRMYRIFKLWCLFRTIYHRQYRIYSILKPWCLNCVPLKFTRCTEFSATMLELHTIGFTQVCRILKPWCLSMNYVPQKLPDAQNSQPQCLNYTPLNFTRHTEFLSHDCLDRTAYHRCYWMCTILNYVILKFAGCTEFLSHGACLEPRTTNLSRYTEPWCLFRTTYHKP